MMLKVMIYGYATGVVSSRGLARKLQEDVAFRVLAAENFPSHRTLCEFRRRHLGDFNRMFVQVVRLAAETGVANASKRNPKGGRPYQREYGEPDGKAQDNFTDPQSRIMKTPAEGFQQCYNAQLAVEGENQLIVAVAVASNASDQGRLTPLVDAEKHPAKARMARKLATEAGRARYTRAQVAVGGTDRMDQGSAGFSVFQRAEPEQGPGRMGLGCA